MTCKKRILLTGARALCALDLSRHLHSSGHDVVVADTTYWHPIRFSNAISKFHLIPSPRFAEEQFVEALLSIVKNEKIDLLIPLWEEGIYLSRHKSRFPDTCEIFCSPFETLLTLHNKWRFIRQLEKLNFKIPETRLIKSRKELLEIDFPFSYVLKACYSRGPRNLILMEPGEKIEFDIDRSNPWIAQEFITGTHHCSYSICHQGRILAHAVYPVEFTMDGCSCLAFRSIEHPANFEWVTRFVKSLNYTGQMSLDFIEKPNGDLYAIECNPRATSGLHLFSIEEQIDKAFLNKTAKTIIAHPGNSQQLAMGMLLYGWKQGLAEGRFWKYMQKLFSTRDVICRMNDLKPFLSQPFLLSYYVWDSWKRGLPISRSFNHDLEWNQDPQT